MYRVARKTLGLCKDKVAKWKAVLSNHPYTYLAMCSRHFYADLMTNFSHGGQQYLKHSVRFQ